jgi:hypothetical protein
MVIAACDLMALTVGNSARGVGCRYCGRIQSAVRRTTVLRRTARRVHLGAVWPGTDPSWAARRGVQGS